MISTSATESKLLGRLDRLAVWIRQVCSKTEAIPGKRPEILALVIYAIAHLVMAIFHEPWYDEAVAWQIARCASVRDILLEIPHYEGHPPLWHLILLPFAKLGAPYELSLTLVSLIFAGAAVSLIVWKSPFPRIVRLLLPFTYFFFYQYGVISRPYCVMMLAFVLLAMSYPGRNEKPGRYTACLMLLCLTSAYGIVIAGGLAIVWVWEIWNRQRLVPFLKSVPKDRRIWWLAALLVLALLLIAEIMPREDTFATTKFTDVPDRNNLFVRLVYMLFILPADVSMTSVYAEHGFLKNIRLSPYAMGCVFVLGVIIWLSLYVWGKRKKLFGELFIPYILYAVFSSLVYVCAHHIGIGLLLIVFWLWITCKKETVNVVLNGVAQSQVKHILNGVVVMCSIAMVISLSWSIRSCIIDVFGSFSSGRNEAAFIAENGLDDYRIMTSWDVYYDEDNNVIGMDINHTRADNIAPYFDHNLFFNFNDGRDDLNYSTHRCATDEETAARLELWQTNPPDVLYMNPKLEVVYDQAELSKEDYILVYSELSGLIWKGNQNRGRSDIYVHRDLAEELGLKPVVEALPRWMELVAKLMG